MPPSCMHAPQLDMTGNVCWRPVPDPRMQPTLRAGSLLAQGLLWRLWPCSQLNAPRSCCLRVAGAGGGGEGWSGKMRLSCGEREGACLSPPAQPKGT